MIILAVDYGDVRTGLAVCDKSEFLASPVGVITERNREVLVKQFQIITRVYTFMTPITMLTVLVKKVLTALEVGLVKLNLP